VIVRDEYRNYQFIIYTSYLILIGHVVIEFVTDLKEEGRQSPHGRYGTQKPLNLAQSGVIAGAILFDMIYFIGLITDVANGGTTEGGDWYLAMRLLAAFLWFVTAILALVSRKCIIKGRDMENYGNMVFMGSGVLLLIAAWMLRTNPSSGFGIALDWIGLIAFVGCAALFTVQDFRPGKDVDADIEEDDDEEE
jgi:hypothetical protein